MRVKLRSYPMSPKLTIKNRILFFVHICITFWFAVVVIACMGGPWNTAISMQQIISLAATYVFFDTFHKLIDKYTDKQYEVVLHEHKLQHAKLTRANHYDAKDKMFTFPAKVTFRIVKSRIGIYKKQTFFINYAEYVIQNGESVEIYTHKAVNTIEIKNKFYRDFKSFTVSENENVEIIYKNYKFFDIERKTTV